MSFSANAGSFAGARFGVSVQSESHVSLEQRSGPLVARDGRLETTPPSLTRNQCLFLKYYKHKSRLLLSPKVVAEAHPQDARGSPEDECRDPLPLASDKRSRIWRLFRKRHQGPIDGPDKTEPATNRRSGDTMYSFPVSALSDVEEVPSAMKVRSFQNWVFCRSDMLTIH